MLAIDRQKIDEFEFTSRLNEIGKSEPFRNPEGKAYAICLGGAFEVITLVVYLRDHGASILLFHADTPLNEAKRMALEAGCSYLVHGKWSEVCELNAPVHEALSDHPGLLQFSSGTTGRPKLIFRPWTEVAEEISAYNLALQPEPGESVLVLASVSHSFGLITGVLAAMERGAEVTVVQNKNPKFQLNMVRSADRAAIYGVPFLYQLLLTLGKGELRFHKPISSGAPLSDSLLQRLGNASDQVWQQYGCTEVGCVSLGTGLASRWDMGRPLSNLRVSLEPAPPGESAGITVEKPSEQIVRTGDAGIVTPEGRLHIYGRLDDLINVGGLKVIPLEIESVIEGMPGVREAVVFRTKHPVWGEAAKALIVAGENIAEADVKSWCMGRLPPYKIPAFIEKVAEIPRLPSGKISRKLLEEQERIQNGN
ncbi:AMP-binding protein [Paenibacillus sp. M1]|uniref:AMP-binding protein n=1 Tax=Paenibacillus haidiansis TaxID=1574488 RepID=A0ABU7VQU1_9BACL